MFDAAPLAIAQLGTDTLSVVLQAPPTDLPSQVPDFVVQILTEVGNAAGGIGDAISGLTPGGGEGAAGNVPMSEHANGSAAGAPMGENGTAVAESAREGAGSAGGR